jgi:predicted alpha/beta hydrolase family esterase
MDIIAYDYSGYGESQGKPSENAIYNDIEEVAYFISKGLHIKFSNVVLFGNSLGSAVSVHIASKRKYKNIKGMILLSPIVSGIKSVSQSVQISRDDLETLDVFSNISKIKEVSCPVFIIHGAKDQIIPVEQVKEMSKEIGRPYKWYPREGDHNNIMSTYRRKFFNKCKMFFDYLRIFFNKQKNDNYEEGSLFLNKEKSDLNSSKNLKADETENKYKRPEKIIFVTNDPINYYKIDGNEEFKERSRDRSDTGDFQSFIYENTKHSYVDYINNIREIEEEYMKFQKNLN